MIRSILFSLLICGVALIAGTPQSVRAAEPIRVTFLSPSIMDGDFWSSYIGIMREAASSLDIELTVLLAEDRFEVMDNLDRTLASSQKPDYLVYIYLAQSTVDILAKAEKAGIKSFITNTDIVPAERQFVGYPRKKFQHWIGHMRPDDELAGQRLAERLVAGAAGRDMVGSNGKLHIAGIGGSHDSTAAIFRERGLRKALQAAPDAELAQYVMSNWDDDLAYKKAVLMLERHPYAKVFWGASDTIALKAMKAMKEAGLTPGKDMLAGGIDWSPEGIKAVGRGEMEASVGGHFLEGVWVLTLLYDYHHGLDFGEQEATLFSQMRLIDRGNLNNYSQILSPENWKKIDFKRFTKTHNPALKEYDFSPDAVVRELAR